MMRIAKFFLKKKNVIEIEFYILKEEFNKIDKRRVFATELTKKL